MNSFLSSYHEICIPNQILESGCSLLVDNEERECYFTSKTDRFSYFNIAGNDELLGKNLVLAYDGKEEHVDVTKLALLLNFDEIYAVDEELGPICYDNYTVFRLWAPFASKVVLSIDNKQYELHRLDRGVYEIRVDGDLDGKLYHYDVVINGKKHRVTDPYAKSSNANAKESAVINLKRLLSGFVNVPVEKSFSKLKSTIYELHIRDFTIHKGTNIVHKGKYLGLTEENCHTKENHPCGIDYLKFLCVSHVQLLPVLDFGSVDEESSGYNWGYDPISYFALEGSYSTNPNDPHARMVEFRKLVDSLHKNGIRVNLDVVYNHMYQGEKVNLNIITPHYFFREENSKLANHSWCGCDFASERKMARRLIKESIDFLMNVYDVDGFRFDLMGLIDLDTIKEVTSIILSHKKDALIYGEGWDMNATGFRNEKFATMKNSHELPDVAFFNDTYRDIFRGHGSHAKLDDLGFLLGNKDYLDGFKFAYLGSSINLTFPKLFDHPNQSINYVECHDNATIYDVINESTEDMDALRLVKLFNKAIMCSVGIPFIHMGQEIGLTKHNQRNTYNLGDYYNQMDYNILDQRFEMAQSFRHYVLARQNADYLDHLDLDKVSFTSPKDGVLIVTWEGEKSYQYCFNVTDKQYALENEKGFYNYSLMNNGSPQNVIYLPPFRCTYLLKD